uniref:Uveal autoantigen with coiled-coil domains and ankyrin repeats n=1 Tax=Phallusia mammillata TaxID=59560 RepID=A0A6F9DWL6_9ASCI|nr:uveal autoantigen with coiled-coil domains and ankyrin repeats [Phallusia mammillata]
MTTPIRVPLMEQDLNKPLIKDVIVNKKIASLDSCASPKQVEPSQPAMPNTDVKYFRNLIKDTSDQLNDICDKWEKYEVPDDLPDMDQISGDVRTTIGQARLVMKERFTQFEGLVDHCEFKTSEKPVTCQDLQGFWDMIYFQVEDVKKKFSDLETRKQQDWKENSTAVKPPVPKKRKLVKKKSIIGQAAQERREQARRRLAAAKAAVKKDHDFPLSFDAGFFKVNSPVRSVVERSKTPCSKERRKPATPSSGNFMHGRFVKIFADTTPNLMKTLDFDVGPSATINTANTASLKPPEKSQCTAQSSSPNAKDAMTTASNLLPVASRASQTEHMLDSGVENAIRTIDQQLQILRERMFSAPMTKESSPVQTKTTKIPYISPKRKSQTTLRSAPLQKVDSDPYEPHYKRLLAMVKILEAEVNQYRLIGPAVAKSTAKLSDMQALIVAKATEMEKFAQHLIERETDVTQREHKENEDLTQLKALRQTYEKEISFLQEKVADRDEISEKLQTLVKCNDQQSAEILNLRHNSEIISDERNRLSEAYIRECKEKEELEGKMARIAEEKEFEQAEFESEKKALEELLEKTEGALSRATNQMKTLQVKYDENSKQILSLNTELEQSSKESTSLQEELDIIRNTYRLQILEQQQEVVNCEVKLRDVIGELEKFYGQMRSRIGETESEQKESPLEIALKTPSKSLVVSALLGNTDAAASPDVESLLPQETLYTRVATLQDLTRKIVSTSKAVASKYNENICEMKVVNNCLRENIESLKSDASGKDERKNEIEKSLRRRLREVGEERDLRTDELQAEQRKTRTLCDRIEVLNEQIRQLRSSERNANR